MSTHANLSPSSAHRWTRCPGSVALAARYANTSSVYADEGSAAHALADFLFSSPQHEPASWAEWVYRPSTRELLIDDFPADGDVPITDDMVGYVKAYLHYAGAIPGTHLSEQHLDFSDVIDGGFGTADRIVFEGAARTLHVIDLKYGAGVLVDAEGNEQLQTYGWAAYRQYGFIFDDVERVCVHVYQPRREHYSVAEYTVAEMDAFGSWLAERAGAALRPDAPLVPGEKQCQWCPAKRDCRARAERALSLVPFAPCDEHGNDLARVAKPVPADTLSVDDIAALLPLVPFARQFLSDLEDRARSILFETHGAGLPGWKLVEGRAPRKWRSDAEAVEALTGLGLSSEQIYDKKLISPAAAEKLVGKKQWPEVAGAVFKSLGSPTLAPAGDKRPAINLLDGSEFDVIPETETEETL